MNRLILLLVALVSLSMSAQRRITPVTPAPAAGEHVKELPDTTRRKAPKNLAHFHDSSGNVILVDTITGQEVPDTITLLPKAPKMIYPLLHSVSVGVNIWDPVMRLLGEHYGLIGFSAGLSMHNRYRPEFEFGLGNANYTPIDGNYTYKGNMAPYFKLGGDYNFFYNSNPGYELYAGFRVGLSHFSYEITDATLNSQYWGESSRFNVPSQSVTATFFELLLGVRVKIWRDISAGWQIRYHGIMSQSKAEYGDPWYIPGYGTQGVRWSGGFSIYYTIPLNTKSEKKVVSDGIKSRLTSKQQQE